MRRDQVPSHRKFGCLRLLPGLAPDGKSHWLSRADLLHAPLDDPGEPAPQNHGAPRKTRFVTLANSYHGETLGALAVGSVELYKAIYRPLLMDVITAPSPDAYEREPGESATGMRFGAGMRRSSLRKLPLPSARCRTVATSYSKTSSF